MAFTGPVQYGAGVKAFVLKLVIALRFSLKRVQQTVHTPIGLAISQGAVLKFVHLALERWETAAVKQLFAAPVMHVDGFGCWSTGKSIGSTSARRARSS